MSCDLHIHSTCSDGAVPIERLASIAARTGLHAIALSDHDTLLSAQYAYAHTGQDGVELIPSGETSSYRSNPLGLAEFTLSRKDPEYVSRAKAVQAEENARHAGAGDAALLAKVNAVPGCEQLNWNDIQIASTIFAVKPGDGSAREQAASCQRVLGAGANIVTEYATKRYRSNLINWGMLPLQLAGATPFGLGDYVLIPNVREALKGDLQNIKAYVLGDTVKEFELYMAPLTTDERQILADGCLINFYKH